MSKKENKRIRHAKVHIETIKCLSVLQEVGDEISQAGKALKLSGHNNPK